MKQNKITEAIVASLSSTKNQLTSFNKQKGFINFAVALSSNKFIDRGLYKGKSLVLDGDSDYLTRIFSVPTDNNRFTLSLWFKRCRTGVTELLFAAGTGGFDFTHLAFRNEDTIQFENSSGGVNLNYVTQMVFRDTHQWTHLTVAVNTDAVSGERVKIYVNGVRVTAFSSEVEPSSGMAIVANSATTHAISRIAYLASGYFSGYLSDFHFVDGQQLDATDFGKTSPDTDKWVISDTNGLAYGTNGFSLDFNDERTSTPETTSTLYDQSGNSNNWTGSSLTTGSFTSDTPIDNHATLNILDNQPDVGDGATLSNGNLNWSDGSFDGCHRSTIPAPSNAAEIYKLEVKCTGGSRGMVGVLNENAGPFDTNSIYWRQADGVVLENNVSTGNTNNTWTTNDILTVIINPVTRVVTFRKNNVDETYSATVAGTGDMFFMIGKDTTAGTTTFECDFGQLGFFYDTSELALSSANLPIPDNLKPQKNANIVLYTGNGTAISSGGNSITGVGFHPDFTWIKDRDNIRNHQVFDAIRGVTKGLSTNLTNTESTLLEALNSFDADGFTSGSETGTNANAQDYWSLNILAGNGSPVSNTDGTDTCNVLTDGINFSIVQGQTPHRNGSNVQWGHGGTRAPDVIIAKCQDSVNYWPVYHKDLTQNYLTLNSTDAQSSSTVWGTINSIYFEFQDNAFTSTSGDDCVFYCIWFGDVFTGGSYTGNGSTDGTFIPSDELLMLMTKESSATSAWIIMDAVRETYNPRDDYIRPDASDAEVTASVYDIDFLSNGLKIRSTSGDLNTSGNTYIWLGIKKNSGSLSA